MCRMILAKGKFLSKDIFRAAVEMCEGITANHTNPIKKHPNGWGALWLHNGEIVTLRSSGYLSDEVSSIPNIETDFLAIHVRHATLDKNTGLDFSHPLNNKRSWYGMHNGFLPTVHKLLGMKESIFDSAEYFNYLINDVDDFSLTKELLKSKIDHIEHGGTSGNIFLINREKAYVWQWYPEGAVHPTYFTMHINEGENATYVSSEVIPWLGMAGEWHPINNYDLIAINLKENDYAI